MKRYIYIVVIICVSIGSIEAQDLIESAISGQELLNRNATPNHLSEMIEMQKTQSTFTPKQTFKINNRIEKSAYDEMVEGAVFLEVDDNLLKEFRKNKSASIIFEIPVVEDKYVSLELTAVSIKASGYKVSNSDGEVLTPSNNLYYRGIVKGDPNSLAALSISDDEIRLMIADDYGNYVIGKLGDQNNGYIFYNDKKLKIPNNFSCSTPDSPLPDTKAHKLIQPVEKSSSVGGCVQVYVETTYNLLNIEYLNQTTMTNSIEAIFNEVGVLYSNESINLILSEIFIWSSAAADPYHNISDNQIALNLFASNQLNSFPGDLAHLLTTDNINSGGLAAGIDHLCSSYYTNSLGNARGPYAISAYDPNPFNTVPTYSWSVNVITHEIGHNLGSRHTHGCYWNGNNTQIDDCANVYLTTNNVDDDNDNIIDELDEAEGSSCFSQSNPIIPGSGGTIMSYCHLNSVGMNFNLGFGTQPGNLIRNRVTNATCLDAFCPCTNNTDLNVINNFAWIIPNLYLANNNIETTGTNVSTGTVVFRAGNQIVIKGYPGLPFTTQSGAVFEAEAGGEICDPATH